MNVEVRENVPCRSYDLVLDREALQRHHDLLMDFAGRGVASPRGGYSGPHRQDGSHRFDPDLFRAVFFLNEAVCDEYEREMGIAPAPAPR